MNQRPSTIRFLLLLITCAHFVTLTHSIMGSASVSASGRYNDILLWSIATSSSSSSSSSSVQNPKSFLVKSPAAAVVRQDQKKECESESARSSRDSGGPHIIVTAPALIEEQVKVVGGHRSLNRDRKHSNGNSIKKHMDRPRYSGSFMLKRTEMMLALEDDGTNDLMKLAHRKNFHWLMDAWTFSNERDAPLHVEDLLDKMEELYEKTGIEVIDPDSRSYTKAITAWSRKTMYHEDAPERALSLLSRMNTSCYAAVKANAFSYTAVVETFSNAGAPVQAEEIFEQMVLRYQESGDEILKPTVRSFNAVINAWAKSSQHNAPQRAESILKRMDELYLSGNVDAKPNRVNFNCVIDAWGKSGDAKKAEELLQRMELRYENGDEDVKPNVRSFNTVMDAWAKSREPDAGKQAERLLEQMEQLYLAGNNDVKPDVRSYNAVMNAWAKSGDPNAAQMATNVLERLERKYEEGDKDLEPDFYSFSTVIHAIARSDIVGKEEMAFKILLDMKKFYKAGDENAKPNLIIYNAVLNACAYSVGGEENRQRAMEIAHATFKELQDFGDDADEITYGTFIKACGNLMPHGNVRASVLEALFKKCKEEGKVGEMVIRQMFTAASNEMYQRLIGSHVLGQHKFINVENLPSQWTYNLKRSRRREDVNI